MSCFMVLMSLDKNMNSCLLIWFGRLKLTKMYKKKQSYLLSNHKYTFNESFETERFVYFRSVFQYPYELKFEWVMHILNPAMKIHRARGLWKSEEQSGCWVWESRGQTHEILVPQSHSPAHQQRHCAESQTQKAWLLLQLCLDPFIQSGELSIIYHTVLYCTYATIVYAISDSLIRKM